MPELPTHLERLAHDLRGPLAPLQTAAYLLQRDDLEPERRRELAEIVERQTARLGSMIGEVGDWVRAGQSRLVGHRERTELGLLIDLACTTGIAAGPGTGTLEPQLEYGLDRAQVEGDPQRLAQMLGTVIAYARSRGGGIELTGRRLHGDMAQLCIAEHGPAMPADALAALFEAPEPAPFDEGLGLRLLIAQAIAHAHDGRLSARAGTGGGTEYLVELPLAAPGPDDAA